MVMRGLAKRSAWLPLLGGLIFANAACNAILGNDDGYLAVSGGGASSQGGAPGSGGSGTKMVEPAPAGSAGLAGEAGESSCGDGVTQSWEQCDDQNDSNVDDCTNACTAARCGDDFLQGTEKCDDGNEESGDGCSADCKREATFLAAGGNHTCALLGDGHVKCWGANRDSQLGLGFKDAARGDAADEMGDQLPIVNLGSGRKARTLSAGEDYNCAIFTDNSTKCWGYNLEGELGIGDDKVRGDEPNDMGDALPTVDFGPGRSALSIGAGAASYHSCAVLDDHSLKCWGENDSGQLGLGNLENRGDQAHEMGTYLRAVDLGTGLSATFVAVGSYHVCALLDTAAVKCWGSNSSGSLGLGDATSRGGAVGQMGDDLLPVNVGIGRTAKFIAAGATHTCAVLDNGAVKCWGSNTSGQLGVGDALDRGAKPDDMRTLPTVNLGTGRTALTVVACEAHSCVLLDDHSVKCWGGNLQGQLGLRDTDNRGMTPEPTGDRLLAVDLGTDRSAKQIVCGMNHTCALLDNGAVKCWGVNDSGQLGLGDANSRGGSWKDMGDALPAVLLDE